MKKIICGIIIGTVITGIAYSAPKRIDNLEMEQKRKGKQLIKQIDAIQNLADVKVYLRKLTKLVVLE